MRRHNAWSALVAASCTLLAVGCAQSNPNFSPNLGGPTASPHATVAMGRVYEQQGNHLKANELYQQALAENPQEVEAHRRLAILACKKEDWASAEKHFQSALSESPEDIRVLNDFGYALYLQERHQDAERLLRKVLEIDPKNERAGINLGLTLGAQERLLESFQTFMEYGSEAEAYTNLAFVHTALGNLDEAEKSYYKAISLDEDLEPAIEGLAQLASRKKANVQTKDLLPKSQPTPGRNSLIAQMSPHDPNRFPESLYSEIRSVKPLEKDLVKALPEQPEAVKTLEEVQQGAKAVPQVEELPEIAQAKVEPRPVQTPVADPKPLPSVKSEIADTKSLLSAPQKAEAPEVALRAEESVTYAIPVRLVDADEDCPTHACNVPFPEPEAKVVRSEHAEAELEIASQLAEADYAPVVPARLAEAKPEPAMRDPEVVAAIVQPLPRMGGFNDVQRTSSLEDATVIPLPDHPELTELPQQVMQPMSQEELEATPIRSLPGLQTSPKAQSNIELDDPRCTPILGLREATDARAHYDEAPTEPITSFPTEDPQASPIRPITGEVTKISYQPLQAGTLRLGQTTQLQLPAEEPASQPSLEGLEALRKSEPTNLEMPSIGHAEASDQDLPSAPTPYEF